MSNEVQRNCQALTKAGNPCKRFAMAGSDYCSSHQSYEGSTTTPVCVGLLPDGTRCRNPQTNGEYCALHIELAELRSQQPAASAEEVNGLIQELEGLVGDLQSQVSDMKTVSDFTPRALLKQVRQNTDRFTPELIQDIMNSLEGAKAEDLADPETWKGMWYMVSYSAQFQAEQLKQRLLGSEDEDDD
ncbi:MAG TPA: hypothetical protein VLL52_04100 [Anaerolineae bacterium]|nr:hypothetical protein [Anaerolineae bacterium]